MRGELKTPKVILAVSQHAIRDALISWSKGEPDRIKNHPLQMLALRQIADQLDAFGAIAPQETKEHYRVAERVVTGILREKQAAGMSSGTLKDDPSNIKLRNYAGSLISGH